jgi:hypothetical protein
VIRVDPDSATELHTLPDGRAGSPQCPEVGLTCDPGSTGASPAEEGRTAHEKRL